MPGDLTPKLTSVVDLARAQAGGGYAKVKYITYTVGAYGPFHEDIPDGPNWSAEAQQKMQQQANALRSLGA